jgi:hypothetical protein
MNENVVDLIDKSLCGINFFKSHILPRSWFHLLYQSPDANSSIKLTNESLTKLLKYIHTYFNQIRAIMVYAPSVVYLLNTELQVHDSIFS